ncbi:hypothetical protein GCM10009664_32880 [Kitasatospora gansuensis]
MGFAGEVGDHPPPVEALDKDQAAVERAGDPHSAALVGEVSFEVRSEGGRVDEQEVRLVGRRVGEVRHGEPKGFTEPFDGKR